MNPQIRLGTRVLRAFVLFWNLLLVWQERVQQRHALQLLESRLVEDMGLSPAQVSAEVSKPFWRP